MPRVDLSTYTGKAVLMELVNQPTGWSWEAGYWLAKGPCRRNAMICRFPQVILCLTICVLASLPLRAADPVAVLQSGNQSGHYLTWKGKPRLLIGDSVTQGWMESGSHKE